MMPLKKALLRLQFILLAAISLFCQTACSQTPRTADGKNTKINFIENAWPEALKQAKLQHKLIFVDAYATWCGPCKMLKALTFTNNKAAEFYNRNFVNVALDMEKGMGPQLAAQWGMNAYPTLIIFDEYGNPVSGTVGFIGAKDLIRFGQDALSKKSM